MGCINSRVVTDLNLKYVTGCCEETELKLKKLKEDPQGASRKAQSQLRRNMSFNEGCQDGNVKHNQ